MVGMQHAADRELMAQVAKTHGINEQALYTCCQPFSGMNADELKRLRQRPTGEVLARLVSERGATQHQCSGNCPKFVPRALLCWAVHELLDIALIDPGRPWQGGELQRQVLRGVPVHGVVWG